MKDVRRLLTRRRITLLGLALVTFATQSWGQPYDWSIRDRLWWQYYLFCGDEGQVCCEPYQSSGGIIGPSHCNVGLGCNVVTNTCERPCGHPGQVCCDGPETWAAQGGPIYVEPSGNIVPRKPMCQASVCDTTRRCIANCGMNAGDPCCGPQPDLSVASCLNPSLACQFAEDSFRRGTCEPCGGMGQIPCARAERCAEGMEEDRNGRCACNVSQIENAPVTKTTACMHWPKRRAKCFERPTGSLVHTILGAEVRPALERDKACVEGAFQVKDGTVLVDVDNPRIWDRALVIGTTRTPQGVSFQAIDHLTVISDGDGRASQGGFFAPDTAGSAASINATLTRIPAALGSFGTGPNADRIDLMTAGIRVGHRPVTVTLQDVQSNHVPLSPFATFRMGLNPDVLLVPVQVFVVFSDQAPGAADGFPRELALTVFDRGADLETGKWRATDGDGRVSMITVLLPYVVLDGDTRPAQIRQHVLPDDIWAQCGVQFRLVNYTRIQVPHALAFPPERTHTFLQGAVRDLLQEVRGNPAFLDGPLTVIVAPWCSDINQAETGSLFPPLGQALVGESALCIRYSSGGTTLAHEIGHSIMSNTNHVDCTSPENGDNLMCPENGGPLLTREQCARAREALLNNPHRLTFPLPR